RGPHTSFSRDWSSDVCSSDLKLVDKLVVGVAVNIGKGPLFSMEERVEMVREEIGPLMPGATEFEVKPFSNLLMHFAMEVGASMKIGRASCRGRLYITDDTG